MKKYPIILMAMLSAAPALRAQVVADGATNTLSNVTNNTITGDVIVGTNGSFTLLIISDNALLTNSANGVIGANSSAKTNESRLVSPTARWFVGQDFYVGSNGSSGLLIVSNGGTLLNANGGFVGYNNAASNNAVIITGSGSTWRNQSDLVVGAVGPGNRVEVSNGGALVNSNAVVGQSLFSPTNIIIVTGAGSLWSNRADLRLGGVGGGNLLVVSNGGWVVDKNGTVGDSSLGNLAWVTGTNSTWSNRFDLTVGN